MLTDEESGVKQWSICEEEEGAGKNIKKGATEVRDIHLDGTDNGCI